MMALVNNWDLKAANNGTSDAGGTREYGVTDLGSTFGRTGDNLTRSKGMLRDYAATPFIEKVTPAYVDFTMHSRPFFLSIFNVSNYRFRTRMESVAKHVPIADGRWIGDRLGALSDDDAGACFRAAGCSAADSDAYARVVLERIAALQAPGHATGRTPVDPRERRRLVRAPRESPDAAPRARDDPFW